MREWFAPWADMALVQTVPQSVDVSGDLGFDVATVCPLPGAVWGSGGRGGLAGNREVASSIPGPS